MQRSKRKKNIIGILVIFAILFFITVICKNIHAEKYIIDSNNEALSGNDIKIEINSIRNVVDESGTDQLIVNDKSDEETWITNKLANMSIEEKIAQLFVITPEELTGVDQVTMAGDLTKDMYYQYPVGGLVYFTNNILSEVQLCEMLRNMQRYSYELLEMPIFTCVDEEGGEVTRISGKGVIDVPYVESMEEIGNRGNESVYGAGREIGEYLNRLGFNVDFAPVADVVTNSENIVIGNRSFGSDPQKVASLVKNFVEGMHAQNVATTLKHFPGHGNTSEDSHYSCTVSYKTLDEIRECDLVPFQAGIEAGTEFIMVGHVSLPNVTGNQIPATLSPEIVTAILREEFGYRGIIITDAMNMAAITDYYSSGEAALKAIQAGVDMILMPYDFKSAYEEVLNAVYCGKISEARIDESIKRILALKYLMRTK